MKLFICHFLFLMMLCPLATRGQTLLNLETSAKAGANGKVLVSMGQNTPRWFSVDSVLINYMKIKYDSINMILYGFRSDIGWRKIGGIPQKAYKFQATGQTIVFPVAVIPSDAEIFLNGQLLKLTDSYYWLNDNTIIVIDPPVRNSLFTAIY